MKRASILVVVAATLAASAAFGALGPAPAPAPRPQALGDRVRAALARRATLDLDPKGALAILDGADAADAALAIEKARALLYAGDCDGAAALLERADLAATDEGAELGDISRGCARGMAATVEVREGDLVVRLQDDDDRALVPLLADVAARARKQLAKDLGVELPSPVRVDLVRDQFTLAALTGLPEEAAHTTGTVAVAKWGKVTMLSPRAAAMGYPWQDTLAHEMTHLALGKGTRDKASLWLQEGVAKREETRWRDALPYDDFPSADALAANGIDHGLARPLDKLGPSIAMLPTPEQAQVAYAEVQSFVRFYGKELGDDALPKLVARIKDEEGEDPTTKAIQDESQSDLAAWDKRWRAHLAAMPRDLPQDMAPGAAPPPKLGDVVRRVRLGELLAARNHHKAAIVELEKAQPIVPFDASVRCFLAESLVAAGELDRASALVQKIEDVHGLFGRWWSLHGRFFDDPPKATSFSIGVARDPFDPSVACEEKPAPDLPSDPLRAALCETARRAPR